MARWMHRFMIWLLLPSLFGVVAFGFASGIIARQWTMLVRSVPVVEFPAVIDLGEHEEGEIVNSRFTIANRGRGELVIDQIRTTCACAGLERVVDGEFIRVESLRLGSHEEAELTLRVSVRGQAGAPSRNRVMFRTNDTSRPEGAIEAIIPRVTGGITTSPASIVFGTVSRGDEARQVVDVFDGATQPRMIGRVVSSNPQRVTVRCLPIEKVPGKKKDPSRATHLARVEVLLNTKEPVKVDESLLVYAIGDDSPLHKTPVTGRIANIVEAMPSSLVLPRSSDHGPLYSGRCLCRSTKGTPLILAVEFIPPGFKAEVVPIAGSPHIQTVRIEYVRSSHGKEISTASSGSAVRLRATVGDQTTRLEIPVTIRSEGSS